MRSYGQFCPIARASEILAERWTPIIMRNLLYGCSTFSELAAGAPGISRSLLSTRLRELERSDVIVIKAKADGNGSTYQLTPAGRELWTVLQAMGDWGARWLELAPATSSPDVVLWSWATAYLQRDLLPPGRVLVRFEFPDQPAPRRRLWLLVDNGDAEVCHRAPGFEEDLQVVIADARAFARWHMGVLEWHEAVRAGDISVRGPRHLAEALPTWNRRRIPARPRPQTAGVPTVPAVVPAARPTGIPGFTGVHLQPGTEGYETARKVWNGLVDRRPSHIARCRNVDDVVAGLRFARERQLPVAVRSGGHGVAGTAMCDDGVVIDLSAMKDVEVAPARRVARAAAGVLWGELDAATQAFALATTGGIVSHTGIAGLTLGGGIGWLMRRAGLTVDNLLEVQVVTAAGERVTASTEENQDLFWGLRGGGGNFGIVTSFTYRLHPVGPTVLAGPVIWPLEQAPEVLRAYRDVIQQAPRELATVVTLRRVPPLPFVPIELHRRPACIITMCHTGDPEEGERVLAPLRRLGTPLMDLVELRPYTALQSMVDATVPHGWHYYWKTANFGALSDDLVDTMTAHASHISWTWPYAVMFHLGGAIDDVAEHATAYPHRGAVHTLNINAVWRPGEPHGDAQIGWARAFAAAVRPHSTGAYLNFLDHDDGPLARTVWGEAAHERLIELKNRYDPDNVFQHNHRIAPTGGQSGRRASGR